MNNFFYRISRLIKKLKLKFHIHNKDSIKGKLIFNLSLLITITLLISAIASLIYTKNKIDEIFDEEMIKTAKIIHGLVTHDNFINNNHDLDNELHQKFSNRYDYKIHIQAFNNDKLIYNSSTDMIIKKPDSQGFSEVLVNQEKWRSLFFYEQDSSIKILILEKYHLRNQLILELLLSILIPFLFAFGIMLIIIQTVVRKQLKPINFLAKKITQISSKNIKDYTSPKSPEELKPFLKSFNDLLNRLNDSLESEKRFTNYAAHELNTPLSIIKLQTQILAQQDHSILNQNYLLNLQQGVDRAIHLVDKLLTLSRIESDEKNFITEKFIFNDVLTQKINYYDFLLKDNNLQLELIFDENKGEIMVIANKILIEIMLDNLLNNLLKYSIKNNQIIIKISKIANNLNLKLTNKTNDIDPQEIDYIFDYFYRGKNSQAVQTGSGLGLSIVKKIIKLHQGSIEVEFKENIFTTKITLPILM